VDLQQIISAIAGFLAAGAITMLFKRVAKLEDKHAEAQLAAAQTFVTKTDYRQDIDELKKDVKELLRAVAGVARHD
jgi:hypothetical protein